MPTVVWIVFAGIGLFMSLIGFSLMGADKSFARSKHRRIPEKTLFLIATALGSPGILAGMHFFRHKTKHISFVVGILLILLVQIGLAVLGLYLIY